MNADELRARTQHNMSEHGIPRGFGVPVSREVDAAVARRRGRTIMVGRWRFHFWRGPTKLGVHRSGKGSGAAGLGAFGVNWIRRSRRG